MVHPGFELEPPAPDEAKRLTETLGASYKTAVEEVVRLINNDHERGNTGYCLCAKGVHPLALLTDSLYDTCVATRECTEETTGEGRTEAYYYEAVFR